MDDGICLFCFILKQNQCVMIFIAKLARYVHYSRRLLIHLFMTAP